MTDLVPLGIVYESKGAEAAERTLEQLPAKVAAAERATDSLGAASAHLSREMLDVLRAIEQVMRGHADFVRGMAEGAAAALKEAAALQNAANSMTRASDVQERIPAVHQRAIGSSKALQAATLNLSRQFTDVGVTAAMGMNPLMIFIQQAPQIADAMGLIRAQGVSVGTALKGMAAEAAAALAPFALFAAAAVAVGVLVKAFMDGRKESAAFANALQVTNNYAGVTASSFEAMADRISQANDASIGSTKALLMEGVASGKLQGETLELAVQSAQKLAQMTGQSASSILKSYEQMKGGIAKFGAEHALQYHDLTLAQLKHIELLEKEGRASEASLELMRAINARTSDMTKNYGFLEKALHGVANAASGMWNALLDIGRQKSPADVAKDAAERLGQAQARLQATDKASPQYADRAAAVAQIRGELIAANRANFRQTSQAANKSREAAAEADKIADYFGPKDPKTPKGPKPPRDMTDERQAQIDQALATAKAEELRATLALTRDVHARADLQRQMLDAETKAEAAQVDRQIAAIKDDKGLSDAKKKDLLFALNGLKAQQDITALLKQRAITEAERSDAYKEQVAESSAAAQAQFELDDARARVSEEQMRAQASLLKSGYAQDVANIAILKAEQARARLAIQRQINDAAALGLSANEVEILKLQLKAMQETQAAQLELAQRSVRLVDAIASAIDSVRGFKDAFRRRDWASLFDNLAATIETIQASFAQQGLVGGGLTAASAIGSLVGGKTGKTLSSAAGLAAGGMYLGGALGNMGMSMALSSAAAGTSGAAGLALMQIGSALPVIGLIAGAGLILSKLLGPKPTNHGAGFDLITGAITGDKRNADTEKAAVTAGQSIKQGQDLLKSLGATLKTEIQSVVVGTRDPSQIRTTDGRLLTAAKGDGTAALETALKAVLEGAEFVNDAQKKLVDNMLAAGAGFDDIATALRDWQAKLDEAKSFTQGIGDQLLKLTDPRAYDLTMLQRAQEARAKQLSDYLAGGFIDQAEFDLRSGQLKALNELEIADALKKYNEAAADAANDVAEAAAKTIGKWEDIAESLGKYRQSLLAQGAATASPLAAYRQAKSAFDALVPGVRSADVTALQNLQSVGDAYISAARNVAPDSLTVARVIDEVQRLAGEGEAVARGQSGEIYQQIADNTAQLVQQIANLTNQLIAANQTIIEQNKQIVASGAKAANALDRATRGEDGFVMLGAS